MKKSGYNIYLNFSNFLDIEIEEREVNGKMEKVCVIPMRMNGIRISNNKKYKGIAIYAKMLPAVKRAYNQSHYLVVNPSDSAKEERVAMGLHPLIIIGNAYNIFTTETDANPATVSTIDKLTNLTD